MNGYAKREILDVDPDIQRVWIRAVRECMAPESRMSRTTFLELVGWEKSTNWLEALENGRIKNVPHKFLEVIYAVCEVPDEYVWAAMCPHLIKLVQKLKEELS